MTTATKDPVKPAGDKKAAAAPPAFKAARELFAGPVKLDKIAVVSNVRKKFDDNALKELAASIMSKGIIQSLTLRPDPKKDGHFLLVAGERRLRAAKAAGLVDVPARVLELNDQDALLYQVDENLHRKDLGPIEEARGFKLLIDAKKYDVVALAQLIDKSVVYVYRSTALLELPKEIVDAIEEGVLTPAHGHQILRVPPEKRAKFCKLALERKTEDVNDDVTLVGASSPSVKIGSMTAKELQVQIDSEVGRALSKAQFPRDTAYAGEVPCASCPMNAANQGMLFDGATEGRCLSKPCFDKKTEQVYLDLQAEGKKKWPTLEFVGRGKQDNYKKRSIDGLPGNAMIMTDEHGHAVIKKLLADKPHKLGYAVVLPKESSYSYGDAPKRWDKARLVLVVKDPPLIGGVTTDKIVDCTKPEKTKKKGSARSSGSTSQAQKTADPKTTFIDSLTQKAVFAAVAEKGKAVKMTIEDWRKLAERAMENLDFEIVGPILGKDADSTRYGDEAKATEEQLRAIVILESRFSYEPDDGDFKAIGVDVAKVRKAAKAVAEKKWAELEAAKKTSVTKK